MNPIEQQLSDFADNRIDFEGLGAAVRSIAAKDAAASSRLMHYLSEAHEEGLVNADQCHSLLLQVVESGTMEVTDSTDDEQTQTFVMSQDDSEKTVGVGSIIKGRFILEEKLGEGGMGVVYRARDKVRVEAKDRHPHVAIKVLNEDFKQHPESFIALQRECRKAQKLAHPNIATVYDFDRTGRMAYMTMELLEGLPLNAFLKQQVPEGGLSFKSAWPIIKDLGDALAYAHKNNLVHSDFKPANAFICDNGTVKVIDFGIARAVRNPEQADQTMFDASTLGAFTPAYASPEMLEGEDPDPRDDLFALAVVTYMLLSGEHPFNRNSATVAKAAQMRPDPIQSLTKLQNLALSNALDLEQESRTADIPTFLSAISDEDMLLRKVEAQALTIKILAGGLAISLGAIGFLLAQ